jgi:hypothetical protein
MEISIAINIFCGLGLLYVICCIILALQWDKLRILKLKCCNNMNRTETVNDTKSLDREQKDHLYTFDHKIKKPKTKKPLRKLKSSLSSTEPSLRIWVLKTIHLQRIYKMSPEQQLEEYHRVKRGGQPEKKEEVISMNTGCIDCEDEDEPIIFMTHNSEMTQALESIQWDFSQGPPNDSDVFIIDPEVTVY